MRPFWKWQELWFINAITYKRHLDVTIRYETSYARYIGRRMFHISYLRATSINYFLQNFIIFSTLYIM